MQKQIQPTNTTTALVPFDPRFHKFDFTTVADAAQQKLMNTCRSLGRATESMVKEVRRDQEVVNEIKAAL